MPRHRLVALGFAAAFGAVGVVHLIAQLVADGDDGNATTRITQWLLMPLLATAFAAATTPHQDARRSRTVTWVLVALGWSWLGDAAPDLATGDTAFLLKVGFFLIAQLCYIVAFWPFRDRSVLRVRRGWLLCYLAAIAALVVACAPHAGALLVPILVYGGCLGTMAVLATGLPLLTAVGGAVFLVSDGLIALQAFVPGLELAKGGFWVMSTYLVAQALITLGVLRAERRISPGAAGPRGPRRRTVWSATRDR